MRLIAYLFVLGFTTTALAQSGSAESEARRHFESASAYYETARYVEALREFEESYRLSSAPALLFNLGLTHQQLGHRDEAVAYFDRYLLEADEDAPNRDNVERRIASLRAEDANETIHLPAETVSDSVDSESAGSDSSGWRTGGIISLSIAGLALGGALTSGLLFASLDSELEACQGSAVGCDPQKVDQLVRRARAFDATAAVSLAAFATGLVMLILAPKDDQEDRADSESLPQLEPVVGSGLAGARLRVRF